VVWCKPPAHFGRSPNRYVLRHDTELWRVHRRPHGAWQFKGEPADVLWGGARFDATDADKYPYLYAGLSPAAALGETLLRDVAPNESGDRVILNKEAAGRAISMVTLTRDLNLVSLIDAESLGVIGQDRWLVDCSGHDYAFTRDWAHWVRRQAPWSHGFIWDSKRMPGEFAIVVFGDRLARDFGDGYEQSLPGKVTGVQRNLGDRAGADWASEQLRRYGAIVSRPGWLQVLRGGRA
jgi:hypothetical protein